MSSGKLHEGLLANCPRGLKNIFADLDFLCGVISILLMSLKVQYGLQSI